MGRERKAARLWIDGKMMVRWCFFFFFGREGVIGEVYDEKHWSKKKKKDVVEEEETEEEEEEEGDQK